MTRAAVLAEPALFTSFTLLGSGPSRLTGRRADMLDHLEPLLEAGGVPLVHETLEQVAMTDPKAQAVPAADPRVLRPAVPAPTPPAGLRGMADAMLAEPDRVAELPRPGCRCSWRTARPTTPGCRTCRRTWRAARARHEVIDNSIHSPAVENPPRTLEVLLDFWASASARA